MPGLHEPPPASARAMAMARRSIRSLRTALTRSALRAFERSPASVRERLLAAGPARMRARPVRVLPTGARWDVGEGVGDALWLAVLDATAPDRARVAVSGLSSVEVLREAGAVIARASNGRTATVASAGPVVDLAVGRAVGAALGNRPPSELPATVPDRPADLARTIRDARTRRTVVAPASWWTDVRATSALVTVAASGAPVHTTGPLPAAARVGPATAGLLTETIPTDSHAREIRSVRLRRAVMTEHGPRRAIEELALRLDVPGPPVPGISVLLASRRPDDLPHAIDQIARQRLDVQVVVGLHGGDWPESTAAEIERRWNGPLVVESFPDEVSLGAMLQVLSERADGELITKWDDDDWYGDDHLVDLVHAYDYSGAELVGKLAEFIYLESSDRTVRRSPSGSESYGRVIAGGTMLTSPRWLREIGGWADAPRNVDRLLIEATYAAGGTTYRTHGFQYVLRRRAQSDSHTWFATDAYFAEAAVGERPGLDLAFADIAVASDTVGAP